MSKEIVGESDFYPPRKAANVALNASTVGHLVRIRERNVLGSLEERKKAVPCPGRIVVEGTPGIVLLFLGSRLTGRQTGGTERHRTHKDHRVDYTATAECLAGMNRQDTPIKISLRYSPI